MEEKRLKFFQLWGLSTPPFCLTSTRFADDVTHHNRAESTLINYSSRWASLIYFIYPNVGILILDELARIDNGSFYVRLCYCVVINCAIVTVFFVRLKLIEFFVDSTICSPADTMRSLFSRKKYLYLTWLIFIYQSNVEGLAKKKLSHLNWPRAKREIVINC